MPGGGAASVPVVRRSTLAPDSGVHTPIPVWLRRDRAVLRERVGIPAKLLSGLHFITSSFCDVDTAGGTRGGI